jgi:valyl-tRNA synthetase
MKVNHTELDKNFNRKEIEHKWYKEWLSKNIFAADVNSKKVPYVIMMPPPNVTGVLHNGHALFVTLQDILARFYRMKGRDVLWLPGTDHAGISTQTVVERELLKNEGKTRHDLGREQFLKRVFAWKDKHGERIIEQLQLMGASADWQRLRFTMDEQCSFAVATAFVKLWNEGLIFRKERLVSWDPATKTALSNEEVEHVERDGELFFFAYRLKDNPHEEIVVATTRPETMLGDTAVAVHPDDQRYQQLIGKKLIHPFIPDREIAVIADNFVDKDFGSGAVKITPAHDPNDFLMGQRHQLPFVSIFTLDATINENGGEFQGLDRFVARNIIKKRLAELGLFRKSEKIKHSVSVSQRSLEDIEPMLSRQYFVNTKPLAKKAYDAVEHLETRIIPPSFKKIWDHFLLNIEDWCISRQLWWGHRIPVYYHIESMKAEVLDYGKEHGTSLCYQALIGDESIEKVLRLALDELDEDDIRAFAFAFDAPPKNSHEYIQEDDVLDTWFSAGLWPFSTLGWPKNTPDLARYYPGSVLETGSDILFFWVARMMMLGLHFMGQVPFRDIYLHAMVRDAHGRKMSKSLGNAIDPIDVIEGITLDELIEKTKTYPVPPSHLPKVIEGIRKDFPEGIPSAGADGLRLSLAMFSGQGRDVKFSIPRVVGYRSFLNKVWNATRFALMNISSEDILPFADIHQKLSIADRSIISRLNRTIGKVDSCITEYHFSEAADAIYHFFWDEYCDKYLECAKVSFKVDDATQQKITKSVLIHLLDASMRMLHPFCPFISEEIWQNLPKTYVRQGIDFCAVAPFPTIDNHLIDTEAENIIDLLFSVSTMIKNGRQSSDLPANQPVPVRLFAKDQQTKDLLIAHQNLIKHLAKTSSIGVQIRGEEEIKELSVINSSSEVDAVIMLKGLIDIDKELARLNTTLDKIAKQKENVLNRLSNKAFIDNAKEEVIVAHKKELADLIEKQEQLTLGRTRLMNAR